MESGFSHLNEKLEALVTRYIAVKEDAPQEFEVPRTVSHREVIDIYGKEVFGTARGCLKILYHIHESGNYHGIHNRVFETVDQRFQKLMEDIRKSRRYKGDRKLQEEVLKLEEEYVELEETLKECYTIDFPGQKKTAETYDEESPFDIKLRETEDEMRSRMGMSQFDNDK